MPTTRKTSSARPLSREGNLSDRIYVELRLRLQQLPLGPDERLLDLEVASAYGTSRMPARDALLRLVNEGYLVGTTRGFVAPVLSDDDVREIFEVRRLLEPEAVAGVAKEIDAAAMKEMTKALKQARRAAAADDGEEMMLANMAFRHAWLSRVGNKRLAATIARFVDHVQTVRLNTLSDTHTRKVVLAGLEGLHAAFANRDHAKARVHMKDFMDAAQRAFFSDHEDRGSGEDDAPPPRAASPARAAARKVH